MHPALPSDPGHALWRRDFRGASGLFAVELKRTAAAAVEALIDDLELFGIGASWGGYESLVLPIYLADHRVLPAPRAYGPMFRVHAGLEDVRDLIVDFEDGFKRLRAHI